MKFFLTALSGHRRMIKSLNWYPSLDLQNGLS